MGFSGNVADRLAIRELIETYADAVFRADEAAWADCWAADGAWHFAGAEVRGLPAILDTWREAMAPFGLTLFHVTPGAIAVDGDAAQARSYTDERLMLAAGGTRRIAGRYDDDLVRTGDGWRFAVRRYTLLHEEAR